MPGIPESIFDSRDQRKAVEEGLGFAPKFGADRLIPVVVTDHQSGHLLMQAFMNKEALLKTIELGEAVFFSRSRNELWHKGATSGHTQKVIEMRTDCDQDCIWLRVEQSGAACHVGYTSCFYRSYPVGEAWTEDAKLVMEEDEKVFDPNEVYG
jgi:phosphoribosyl-AMP cyclohydrolase